MTAIPGVFIPPEAQPYCNSRGLIDWHVVSTIICERLKLAPKSLWSHMLTQILKGCTPDTIGALPIMLELGLDRVVNSLMVGRMRGSRLASHRRAMQYAKDFGINLAEVVGTGADGVVLMRDVQAFRRGIQIQTINASLLDARLLTQRRILANHLRDSLRESRALRAELDESQSRAAATALRLGNEIAEKSTDIEVLRNHIAAVTADRNALQARLFESNKSLRVMANHCERLSKRVHHRRVTHVKLGNELFLNRTGARA